MPDLPDLPLDPPEERPIKWPGEREQLCDQCGNGEALRACYKCGMFCCLECLSEGELHLCRDCEGLTGHTLIASLLAARDREFRQGGALTATVVDRVFAGWEKDDAGEGRV